MRRTDGIALSGEGSRPRKRRSIRPSFGNAVQVANALNRAPPDTSLPLNGATPSAAKPAWMKGVPTPFTAALRPSGAENNPCMAPRCGVSPESSRLSELVNTVKQLHAAPDPTLLLPRLAELRKVLSSSMGPPIQQVLDLGGLPVLLSFLAAETPAIQLEAAWAVTNISAGSSEHAAAVLEAGGLRDILSALESPAVCDRADLCSQLLWILGNIAGDEDARLRDRLLEAEIVGHIGQLFAKIPGFSWNTFGRTQVLRTLTWLMSCLCGGRPAPKLEEVDCAFDYFAQVVTGTEDMEMLSEALWGLHHLVDGAASEEDMDARVARMLSAGFGPGEGPPASEPHPLVVEVVECVKSRSAARSSTVDPAMKILGAMASCSDPSCTELIISCGALKALSSVLRDIKASHQLRENAAWILSNIAAGDIKQAQRLAAEPGVYDALCGALERGPTPEVRCECSWALSNLIRQGTPVLPYLCLTELLRLLIMALTTSSDAAQQRCLLEAIEATMHQTGKADLKRTPLAEMVEDTGFLDRLEELQLSENDVIYRKAASMLEEFFTAESANEVHRKAPMRRPSAITRGAPVNPGYLFGA